MVVGLHCMELGVFFGADEVWCGVWMLSRAGCGKDFFCLSRNYFVGVLCVLLALVFGMTGCEWFLFFLFAFCAWRKFGSEEFVHKVYKVTYGGGWCCAGR